MHFVLFWIGVGVMYEKLVTVLYCTVLCCTGLCWTGNMGGEVRFSLHALSLGIWKRAGLSLQNVGLGDSCSWFGV